jgi:hypothetical protein
MKSRRHFVAASLTVSAFAASAQTPDEKARLNRNKTNVKSFYEMALNDATPGRSTSNTIPKSPTAKTVSSLISKQCTNATARTSVWRSSA